MSENEGQGSNQNSDQAPAAGASGAAEGMTGMSELDMLKSRARMMNISFSNNIGVDALKEKINAKLEGKPDKTAKDSLEEVQVPHEELQPNALDMGAANLQRMQAAGASGAGEVVDEAPKRPESLRERLYRENMALLRCQIVNLDPKKRDLPGEIITVANEYLGTVRKFIPFGEHTENGFHIPVCLYNVLKERKFLNIRQGTRNQRTGVEQVHQQWVPEFAITILDPLTPAELRDLGQAQIAAGSLDNQV